jgi:hypothetical protein
VRLLTLDKGGNTITDGTPIPKDTQKNDDTDNKRRRNKLRFIMLTVPAAAMFVKECAAQMDPGSPLPAAGPSAIQSYTTIGMASEKIGSSQTTKGKQNITVIKKI